MTQSTESKIILIVDDTPTNLEVLSESLSTAGFEVAVAIDGESAIEQTEYNPPELILLDVMMPGIDGFETCRRLKENPLTQGIPVIFMTALSDTVDKVKGLSLGAVDYITKPFQKEEVLARVTVHLKLRNLSKTLEKKNVLLQQLAQDLEQRVAQRTAALSQSLQELRQSQVKLVQSEKMSTLGELVAGVAHEINNPVSFISGNLTHAEIYFRDLSRILQLYQQYYPNPCPEIREELEVVEPDFLLEDLPKVLQSMKVGTERLSNISLALRNFSRSDLVEKIPIDLHEGLDSTLLILKHRFQAKKKFAAIEVIRDYGELPLVKCYPGRLNQVFMNILANAIDALELGTGNGKLETKQASVPTVLAIAVAQRQLRTVPEDANNGLSQQRSSVQYGGDLHSSETNQTNNKQVIANNQFSIPTIRIHTEVLDSNSVVIRIIDNGPGLTESVKQQLFEPMFTTKPPGKGTGLGLSIARQIVEEYHKGRLSCISAPGEGTEFAIEIPIK
ncbi:MAG: response regulator [Symploca sp. SIO2C1]|nr:response regulator [Symploca sp. SIO2C1]